MELSTTEQAAPDRWSPADARQEAVRQVTVFLGVTALLTTATTAVGIASGVDVSRIEEAAAPVQAVMFGQAFIPLLAAVAARLTAPPGAETGWGVRRAPWRALGLGWLVGLGFVAVAAGIGWLTGAAGFDRGGLGPTVVLGLTVLVLPYVVLALGEDVGWRGLLVTRLAAVAGTRTVVLVSGVAWALFHWPLILWLGGTPVGTSTAFTLASYTVGTVAFGAVLAFLQLRWGLWPGVLAHAAANATLYHVVEPLTEERRWSGYLTGETGLIATLVLVALAVTWMKRLDRP